jgi:hypothetical protein
VSRASESYQSQEVSKDTRRALRSSLTLSVSGVGDAFALTDQLAPQFSPVAMDAGQERLYFGICELDMALESSRCMRV